MAKNKNKMKISKEQIMTMNRAISRDIEIENGMRINHKKVHKTAKDYNRKEAKKITYESVYFDVTKDRY